MKRPNLKDISGIALEDICDHLGNDIDSEACKEVQQRIAECPDCRIYLDSIKKTVILCKENEEEFKASDECKEKILVKLTKKIAEKK